jgi:hypothetical protein
MAAAFRRYEEERRTEVLSAECGAQLTEWLEHVGGTAS